MTPRASIIIRTRNEARHLPDLLTALAGQTVAEPDRQVIVVDSGSNDGTLAIAERYRCRVLHISQDEFSFGRSLNIGCAAARGHSLVFVSGHCIPTTSAWLEGLIAPLERGEAALTYGRQQGSAATKLSEQQHFRKCFPSEGEVAPNGFFCNNANAAVLADVWASYRFDESLTGLEDLHFAKRVVADGLKIRYVPDSPVVHHHDESWRQVIRRFEREAIALQGIMPEVHVRATDAMRYFAVGTLRDFARARRERRLLKNAWAVAAFRFCQYYGSWKGNHMHRTLSRKARERYFYP